MISARDRERRVHRRVDLVTAGYITRTRAGRRNRHGAYPELPFRHPLEQDHQVGELLEALGAPPSGRARPRS